jgi:hypothetical protein
MLEPWFTGRGFHGCPFMNASLELHDPGHPATAVAARHKTATRDAFAAAARAAGLPAAGVVTLADQLALLFDGAIAQAQMRDPRAVARAALAAATTLASQKASQPGSRQPTGSASRAAASGPHEPLS